MHSLLVKGSALFVATVMVEGIAANQIYLVTVLSAGVVAVIGISAWIDSRIQKAILTHTATELQRHELILEKIDHLREMMEARMEARSITGEFHIKE